MLCLYQNVKNCKLKKDVIFLSYQIREKNQLHTLEVQTRPINFMYLAGGTLSW